MNLSRFFGVLRTCKFPVQVWPYILSGVMFCQNLCAYYQKLSHGSLSMLHGHCVSVSHLGLGCRENHSSVNRDSPFGTEHRWHSIVISFFFFRITEVNVLSLKTHIYLIIIPTQQEYLLWFQFEHKREEKQVQDGFRSIRRYCHLIVGCRGLLAA